MSLFDGNAREMPEHQPVDDGAIEAALGGTARGEALDPLKSFVSSVRSAIEAVPAPSTAMAAVLAAGFSTEKGDLSATAASNVNGPASQEAGLSKWRKAKMKIQGFLAGLGVAGKIALGVGVAAAATTGAGATGMLPFSVPGLGHPHHHRVLVAATTTTTQARAFATTTQRPHANHTHKIVSASQHTPPGTGAVAGTMTSTSTTNVTTSTLALTTPTTGTTSPTSTTATTTQPTETTTTTQPTDTTTTQPSGPSIELSCSVTGPTQVTCAWSSAPATVAKYALWRWTTGGNGSDYAPIYQSANGLTFVDNNVTPGVPYTYRVFTTLGDGSQGPISNKADVT
ncbi:MAG: hypothetical protein ACLPVY_27770 [Acidimicrobiia bacterium]